MHAGVHAAERLRVEIAASEWSHDVWEEMGQTVGGRTVIQVSRSHCMSQRMRCALTIQLRSDECEAMSVCSAHQACPNCTCALAPSLLLSYVPAICGLTHDCLCSLDLHAVLSAGLQLGKEDRSWNRRDRGTYWWDWRTDRRVGLLLENELLLFCP